MRAEPTYWVNAPRFFTPRVAYHGLPDPVPLLLPAVDPV
jgi:hypothetical protein